MKTVQEVFTLAIEKGYYPVGLTPGMCYALNLMCSEDVITYEESRLAKINIENTLTRLADSDNYLDNHVEPYLSEAIYQRTGVRASRSELVEIYQTWDESIEELMKIKKIKHYRVHYQLPFNDRHQAAVYADSIAFAVIRANELLKGCPLQWAHITLNDEIVHVIKEKSDE